MRDLITTLLDVIGLLAVAIGIGVVVATWSTGAGIVTAGVLVLAGSQLVDRIGHREEGSP